MHWFSRSLYGKDCNQNARIKIGFHGDRPYSFHELAWKRSRLLKLV
ncbi:MAG: hypothetical protein VKJ64_05435 [Leptolyngbyaceae bacterium]|nr:hypothetical protein [Leptolyngbyaceae bacterium]